MDKTITISGKPVTFRKTGGTILRYKREFGRELNSDLAKIANAMEPINRLRAAAAEAAEAKDGEKEAEIKGKITSICLGIETEWIYDMLFIMAQQADPSITDELAWLDSFDDFNAFDVFGELMNMISGEQEVSRKNA